MDRRSPGEAIEKDDIHQFLVQRGFSPKTIVAYARGVASQNFRAIMHGDLDLTVRCDYRRSLTQVQQDRIFSEAAHERGINVPRGPWQDGCIGGVATVARPTLEGTSIADLSSVDAPSPTAIGTVLSTLHRARRPALTRRFFYAGLLDPTDPLWREFDAASANFADDPALRGLMREGLGRLRGIHEKRAVLLRSPIGVIHGDFNPPNILCDQQRLSVIDWEKACIAPTFADIVQAIYYFSAHYRDLGREFVGEFLEAYRTTATVDSEVLRCWFECYPAFIFLRDTVSASATFAGCGARAREEKARVYLRKDSAPRFRHLVETEHLTTLAL